MFFLMTYIINSKYHPMTNC